MASIHLTGATGYIGLALLEQLRSDGHSVEIASYRLPEPPPTPIKADILIHLAAAGGGSHHFKRPGDGDATHLQAVNVQGMKTLLDARANPQTRVLYFSSNSVYGTALPPLLADESTPTNPQNDYSRSKTAAEFILKESGGDYMILRPCGVFGPSPAGKFGSSFLNLVTDRALKEGVVDVFGGEQGIDTLFLDDLVAITTRICHGEWHSRQTYNVAGDIVSIKTMMETLANVPGYRSAPCKLHFKSWVPTPAALIDNGKLKRDFPGWRPTLHESSLSKLVEARARLIHSQ
jgi:nucleoside-diphosphate-sugar epimerase